MLFAVALAAAPSWYLTEKIDPITDRKVAMASVSSGEARLAVGCTVGSEGKIGVIAVFPTYLAMDAVAGVDIRFDKQPAFTVSALFNRKQIQIRSAKSAEAFVTGMRTASRVVLQTNGYDGQTHTVVFSLPESSAAIDTVLSTCTGYAES